MKKLVTIIILGILVTVLLTQTGGIRNIFSANTAYAVGDLTVSWGVPEGDPIFTVTNWAPGDSETHNVTVTNAASTPRPVGIKGLKTNETGNISSVLDIEIRQGATTLYAKTLAEFFSESASPNGIPLTTLNAGANTTYTIEVTFNESAGNEYQGKTIVFDLQIGITFDVPLACQNIDIGERLPIFGTQKSERINGTAQSDIIIAFEGSDTVDGKGGDDCIIGGIGSDALEGGNGNDFLFGEAGSDTLEGGNGNDYMDGGDGSDSLEGGNGDDTGYGQAGSDNFDGNNGIDTFFGGAGSDSADGGNGNDILHGEAGTDHTDGRAGVDTCTAESRVRCEL